MTAIGLENHQDAVVSINIICKAHVYYIINMFAHIKLTAITCPKHDAPSYGTAIYAGYRPGHTVHYRCNTGYKLVGINYRTCGYNGTWNGGLPRCIREQP